MSREEVRAQVEPIVERVEAGGMSIEDCAKALLALMSLADSAGIGLGLFQGDSGISNKTLAMALGGASR